MIKRPKVRGYILEAARFLLILLWVYAASSKLMDFTLFRVQIEKQPLFPWIKHAVIYGLPPAELIVALLLLFMRTYKSGLYASFILLAAFTLYVGLVLLNTFGRIP